MVAGGFDYLVKTRLASMADYRRFLGRGCCRCPVVRETRTYAVMEEVKSEPGALPVLKDCNRIGRRVLPVHRAPSRAPSVAPFPTALWRRLG